MNQSLQNGANMSFGSDVRGDWRIDPRGRAGRRIEEGKAIIRDRETAVPHAIEER